MIGLKKEKKKKTNLEKKETHIDNRGFGFRLKFVLIFFFYIVYGRKGISIFFGEKSKINQFPQTRKQIQS